ncbi:ceramide glucosyltransferase [Pseudotabrizicola sp. 4114]|uniref:ceramide glucosyltransferase n=1 Tax=Pseudotabrizicola sp. 4114 TaxID=2817731 RepID=UPI00285B546D|nr:ceramide glucosyltransferase [Pseudorhodobacter sp. 4114]
MMAMGFAAAAAILMLAHLVAVWLYLRRLDRPQPTGGVIGQPFVTLLRPVCGLDPFDEETLQSSFDQDYPRYEIIFCAQSPDDPAIGLVNRLIARNPRVPARLLVGYDRISGNPKLNNVWKGWNAASGDWVCMTDSNLLLPPDYLATVVGSWGPATGIVSSPPLGIRPQNLGGHLECAFLNSNQALLQFAAGSVGPAYAQGKTLFFNKPLLEHAGGLRALGQTLAEDAAATRITRDMGREVTLTPLPFTQPIGRRTLAQVWSRQLRWSRVRRDAFPLLFAFEVLNGGVAPITCVFAALTLSGADLAFGVGYIALWYLAEVFLAARAGWPMGVQGLFLLILRDLMMPVIWLTTFLRRGFDWRGTAMTAQPAASAVPAE